MIAIVLPLLLAGVSVPAADVSRADQAALDAQVARIFSPYQRDMDDTAAWDYPIWSAEVNALVAKWKTVMPDDGPDDMNDGDWLCQCQDWDAEAFKANVVSRRALPDGSAELVVKIDLGFGDPKDIRDARMIFRHEAGGWKLDDIFAEESFPKGVKQQLRETIAADIAMAKTRK
jgi:hypothetical protein